MTAARPVRQPVQPPLGTVAVRLPTAVLDALEAAVEDEGTDRSTLIRRAVEDWLRARGDLPPGQSPVGPLWDQFTAEADPCG